jgi:Lrp/AsnC family leucine-responsive transcriptional regulator
MPSGQPNVSGKPAIMKKQTSVEDMTASNGQAAATVPAKATRAAARARIKFDAIDVAILMQLQTDSKITNAALAQRVGISPPSTLERVKKLEAAGVIKGYVALLDPLALGKGVTAMVMVTLREHGLEAIEAFKREIVGFPEVQAAWHTTGEEDFILRVIVSDMTEYEYFAVHKLSRVSNIGRVKTSFCLSAAKFDTRVPLDAIGNGSADITVNA